MSESIHGSCHSLTEAVDTRSQNSDMSDNFIGHVMSGVGKHWRVWSHGCGRFLEIFQRFFFLHFWLGVNVPHLQVPVWKIKSTIEGQASKTIVEIATCASIGNLHPHLWFDRWKQVFFVVNVFVGSKGVLPCGKYVWSEVHGGCHDLVI